MFGQCEVLCPNPKNANQYVINVKHELTCMQGGTYTSLDKRAQAWSHSIICAAQPIFSKTIGGKQLEVDHPTYGSIAIVERLGETTILFLTLVIWPMLHE